MSNFNEFLNKLNQENEETQSAPGVGTYWKLSETLQTYEISLREHIQAITKTEIEQIIGKLKSNAPLDKQDLEYIRLWIVGDAETYVKLENNYNDWIEELKRLVGEINSTAKDEPSFTEASKLRALLLDATRVLGNIVFFQSQKDRVKQFVESTEEIDPSERDILIDLLQGKMNSPKF